ncbi:flagellar FlbD family protein [Agromyces mediolanus]|jgi:flagellar protein FlbD|uniref:Flagellar FlbD family protein n=2 Tax=Agromyces TaxID=33877 RepID=A0A918CD31_AGRME|nr:MULTISPECIES: flagellar FlbD family protein [Agromyces]MCD1572427.1 flagellar FlbD family protein [Agromyces mediolanus]UOE27312.1 flagellar FlbD family protein [Agromyces soli]GGR19044.1 flagellar FlbD family protein [Agromyces mediolanus]GLJ71357.1 flagellar FlbD family protein [Agromyces mediolanus]
MIVVTRLNGSSFALNADLVERIHATPDTTLLMVDGTNYVVTESVEEVIERIVEFRARVLARAQELDRGTPAPVTRLTLAPKAD